MVFFNPESYVDVAAAVIVASLVVGFVSYLCGFWNAVIKPIDKTTTSSTDSSPLHSSGSPRTQSKYQSSKDDTTDDTVGPLVAPRRRHSTGGPFQFAKVAKDFIKNRGGYRRQFSEVSRESLPKPPTEYFEPSDLPEIPQNLNPEFFYLRHNIKVLELNSDWPSESGDIEVCDYDAGDFVVRIGDPDNTMYVVIEGALNMFILHDGKEYLVRRLEKGQTFFSYLSLIDILMNKPSFFRTVSLRAAQKSRVAKYCLKHFYDEYQQNPAHWARPVQIVITKLLHVTMTTLHQYLGLGEELIKKRLDDRPLDEKHRNISGHSMRLTGRSRPRQRRLSSSDATNEFIATAIKWYSELLGLTYADGQVLLTDKIHLVSVDDGQVLVEQRCDDDPSLILVLTGGLILTQLADPEDEDEVIEPWQAYVHHKEIIGGLQLLSNEPAFFQIKGACQTTVALIKKVDVDRLVNIKPTIALPIAYSVLRRLSSFTRAVDFAMDWVMLDSGQAVYRQGDLADSLFVVLSGRTRSVDKKTAIAEYGRGDVLGMVEVIQKRPRSTTVLAVRFSQLARVPEGLLNFIKMQYPQVGFRLVRLLGLSYNDTRRDQMLPPVFTSDSQAADSIAQIKNLHTVAILPASSDVPITAFTCELYHALSASFRVLRLSARQVAIHLGENCLEKLADFRLMHWLNAQEDTFPLVLYECDYTATNWTRRCLRQADTILVIGRGDKKPQKQAFFEEHMKMNQDGIRTRKELILLWKENASCPRGTYEWLKGSWFSGHYHVRAPDRMFVHLEKDEYDESTIVTYYEDNVFGERVNCNSDFARLGRILTGNAVGLVLGGGGARGASHVGIIQALQQYNVPIDIVGGTSIGSMIGGLFAEDPYQDVERRARSWFVMMSSLWRKIWDLTYAHSAMFTGAGFNKTLQDLFGTKNIEDLWLPYFCITTDITSSEMRIQRSGPLWMYARASMSLAGYLPPLCDPVDGHLLLDGGYVNNVPADVMRSMGARAVIAVDVGSATENNLFNYGDSLSGFWVLWRRLNPWAAPVRILGMEEIQSRLAFVSCVRQLELVKKAPYSYYMRPPIEAFKTLDFAKFDTIREVGFRYGIHAVDEMVEKNHNLRILMMPDHVRNTVAQRHRRQDMSRSRNSSFTDLAAQVSRIPSMKHQPNRDDHQQPFNEIAEWEDDQVEDDIEFEEDCDDSEGQITRSVTPRVDMMPRNSAAPRSPTA
uniref:Neuropathy target esterase sws n=1 Tax=Panagrellus redivivus TaxID=6233 RepID=A0A7E4V292_PANRE